MVNLVVKTPLHCFLLSFVLVCLFFFLDNFIIAVVMRNLRCSPTAHLTCLAELRSIQGDTKPLAIDR